MDMTRGAYGKYVVYCAIDDGSVDWRGGGIAARDMECVTEMWMAEEEKESDRRWVVRRVSG